MRLGVYVLGFWMALGGVAQAAQLVSVRPAPAQLVDVALVLAVDVSTSVDDGRYALQRDGLAQAFETPDIVHAIRAGPQGAVAVAVMEFSDPDRQFAVVGWTRIASAKDARELAKQIRAVRRSSHGLTGISDALLAARQLLAESPYKATRKVIDVSSDGMNNIGTPMAAARAAVLRAGITINGLPILTEEPWLATYYTEYVVGGPDAFVMPAESLDSFAQAMQRKLARELVISANE